MKLSWHFSHLSNRILGQKSTTMVAIEKDCPHRQNWDSL
jgi:hypothetical protein